jgi:hypothetical protein
MSLNTFRFAFVGFLAMAITANASTVTMTRTANVERTGTQGAGFYDVYDLFYSSDAGAEFTNYRLIANATTGTLMDPAKLQDDRQTEPPSGLADTATLGAVDTFASTVWAAVGKDYEWSCFSNSALSLGPHLEHGWRRRDHRVPRV